MILGIDELNTDVPYVGTLAESLMKARKPPVVEELPEAKLLGKIVSAPLEYDPSVLVAIPRSKNRDQYGLTNESFDGNDYWRCYECSTITKYGMPVYFMMTIQYNSNSPFIVESKSLKLYLNSFNMTKQDFAEPKHCINSMVNRVQSDLEKILGVKPEVSTYDNISNDFSNFKDLEIIVDYSSIVSEGYNVDKHILSPSYLREHKTITWKFEGFRSNCKITNQPDYASVFISTYNCVDGIDPVSLVKYLTSFRNENHFHEECCELIFKDLNEVFKPASLFVTCSYTRRGGIDISPSRQTKKKIDTLNNFQNIYYDAKGIVKEQFDVTPARTIYQ